jgi:hypothetical protein
VTKATAPKQPPRWNWGLPVTNRAFGPYVAALGQLTLAWNDLHETLAILFSMVMGGGYVGQYLAIWHAIKVDRAQRDILVAAAKADQLRGTSYSRLVPDLEWICVKANAVEDARNDALHSPLWGSQRGPGSILVMPAAGLGHVRAQKLLTKDLLIEFRWCRDASLVLTGFAREIDIAMSEFGLAWPDRPVWPNRGKTKKSKPRHPARPGVGESKSRSARRFHRIFHRD